MKHHARSPARWLLLAPALFALACALLAPAEAGRAAAAAGASAPPARRAAQNANGRAPEPQPTSTVRGRVVYDETTRPVRRARVMLVGESGARGEYGALTDARGEFRVEGVQAGTYFTFVDVPGVLSPVAFVSVDDLRGGGPGVPDLGEGRAYFDLIEVDGRQDVSVTVRARRGAAIAGRVTYADGDPAVNVTVNLMRRGADGRLMKYLTGANLVSLSGLRTDDRGMYRLTGLPPGEYVVGVSESVEHSGGGKSHRRSDDIPSMLDALTGQQFLVSYHPSATSPKEAAAVRVAAGEERDGVDVVIPERALRTVSGVVRARRDKSPLARARVTIIRRDEPAGSPLRMTYYDPNELRPHTATTDEEGRWEFKEIPDGPYTVSVRPAEEYEAGSSATNTNSRPTEAGEDLRVANMNGGYRPPRRKRGYAPARRDLEVSGGDVSEVAVEVGDGARVSGVITVEGGGPLRYVGVTLARVPDGASQPGGDDQRGAEVELNRFNVEGLPAGKFFVQPNTYTNAEKSYYLKSITWKGRDLTREPLELAEGASAEGVEIVYASNPAALRLRAVRAGGEGPAGFASFLVIPLDAPDDASYSGRRLSCMTGDDGLCTIHAAPGEYRVVALPRALRRSASADAEAAKRALTSPRVALRAGETRELEVSVPDR